MTIAATFPNGKTGLKRSLLIIGALAFLANALAMLADPATWYATTPGVAHTGPLNLHFIRDIGVAYLTLALLLAGAAAIPRHAFILTGAATLYLALHALLHVWDIAAARLPLDHLLVDAPGVFLPPLLTGLMTFWLRRDAYESIMDHATLAGGSPE